MPTAVLIALLVILAANVGLVLLGAFADHNRRRRRRGGPSVYAAGNEMRVIGGSAGPDLPKGDTHGTR